MTKKMKYLSLIMIMVMTMIMVVSCAAENTSDNTESTKTGIVGKWKEGYGDIGNVYEFKSDHTIFVEGYNMGDWYGNDVSGQVNFYNNDGSKQNWYYEISGNNLTLTYKENSTERMYFTRM